MTQQQQRSNKGNGQNPLARQMQEKRSINTKGIMVCFFIMLTIAIMDFLNLFTAFAWLFSASPWDREIRAGVNILAGVTFIGAFLFGVFAAKQNE